MDKILVTGVAGFIGSNLAYHLLKNENNYIYGIDNFSHSTMSNLYPLLKNERFEFIEHNLLSEIQYHADFVYHFAGNGDMSSYKNDKYNFILNKIEILKNIISFCQNHGAKLIFPSEYQDRQEKNKELQEYYDCINLLESIILELIDKNKLNCTIARLDHIYGKNYLKNDSRFIPKAINNAIRNIDETIEIDEAHYYTYIDDVVLNLEKLTKLYTDNRIVDLINPNLYLNSDIINFIQKYTKSNSKLEYKSEIKIIPNFKPSINSNFECKTQVIDGFASTIENFILLHYS